MISLPETEICVTDETKKVQKILLRMADFVHAVFLKYDIKYYITYGTLLGAVRHEGFIPWDDDFDICLFDEDYDYAIECLKKELPEWLVIHDESNDPNYFAYWARIRDLNSEVYASEFTDDNYHKYKGISLDLFRLKKTMISCANVEILKQNLSFYKKKYEAGFLDKTFFETKEKELTEKIKTNQNCEIQDDHEVYYFVLLDKIIEPEDVFPLKEYTFEGRIYLGPNNADAMLRKAYGNYMELPPIEKRTRHYSAVKFVDEKFAYEIG